MRFQNESKKVAIQLRVRQFWSEIIPVNSNRTHAARSFDFEITRMISDQIALHSVQLPLSNICDLNHEDIEKFQARNTVGKVCTIRSRKSHRNL